MTYFSEFWGGFWPEIMLLVPQFPGWGNKTTSAMALVALATLVPLEIPQTVFRLSWTYHHYTK